MPRSIAGQYSFARIKKSRFCLPIRDVLAAHAYKALRARAGEEPLRLEVCAGVASQRVPGTRFP